MESIDFKQLELKITHAMLTDQHRLRQKLRSLKDRSREQKPNDHSLTSFLAQLEKSCELKTARTKNFPTIKLDTSLPIYDKHAEILNLLQKEQVLIICGETGSGKSTQLPLYCLEAGLGIAGKIGHTQPRRIAARSIAARLAEEMNSPLGQHVGYKIRFQDQTSPSTYIKLMTDGVLLAESQNDRFLNQYEVIIVDEAHERSLNIDFILGYLKRLLHKRPELKLIITSATIDAARFSEHFSVHGKPATVLEVSGRTYPVEVRYQPLVPDTKNKDENADEDLDWLPKMYDALMELIIETQGDILVFLPTERDILDASKNLKGRLSRDLGQQIDLLPLYGRLSQNEQNTVFARHANRRVVLATNVAESSITVPGIRSVIDLGLARISRYSPKAKMQRLPIEAVSKASANQRKGRCGRLGPGICIRLYSEADFNNREDFTPPEILRTNLAGVILQTKALNLGTIEDFPFLDPPKPASIRDGYHTLFEINALTEEGELTEIGRKLSNFPIDPRLGRMLLAAEQNDCLHEVLVIASALETQDPRERPLEKQQVADQAHAEFKHENSDFLTYLNIWNFYHQSKQDLTRNRLHKLCVEKFLNHNRLKEWADIYHQLNSLLEEHNIKASKKATNDSTTPNGTKNKLTSHKETAIHQSLMTGLLSNIAFLNDDQEYVGAGGNKYNIWPGSVLAKVKPKWVVAGELVETNKRYLRTITRIQPEWIEPIASHLVKKQHIDPFWDPEQASAMCYEKVLLYGMPVVHRRKTRFGKIDPVTSRNMFIAEGLMSDSLNTKGTFFKHNQALIQEVRQLEAKTRKHDLLKPAEFFFNFYDEKIGPECVDLQHFEIWRQQAEKSDPRLLYLEKEDLLTEQAKDLDPTLFPPALVMGSLKLKLEYHLDPGAEEDGVTLCVPQEAVAQLSPHLLGWLVPGLLHEKIMALIRGLPKQYRTMFVPAPESAQSILDKIQYGQGPFNPTIAAEMTRIAGALITPEMLEQVELPRHLMMNIKVIDQQKSVLAISRDIDQLKREFSTSLPTHLVAGSFSPLEKSLGLNVEEQWHKDDLVDWNFPPMPLSISINRNGVSVPAYPALTDLGTYCGLRLYPTEKLAFEHHQQGIRRLFIITQQKRLANQLKYFPRLQDFELYGKVNHAFKDFRSQLMDFLVEQTFVKVTDWPRNAQHFDQLVQQGLNNINNIITQNAALIARIYDGLTSARKAIKSLQSPNQLSARQDLDTQLDKLLPPSFLKSVPYNWLTQFPRYLQGIEMRCRKLTAAGLEADRKRQTELAPFWNIFLQVEPRFAKLPALPDPLQTYRYMLEEFRISLFAQELGTSITISPKRLEKQWETVRKELS